MTDTKGGFLTADDDPFNKQMHAPGKDGAKPAHMSLKEWERFQLLKSLRMRKEGPFEPALGLDNQGKKCRECGSREIDWQWDDIFKCSVCSKCKDKFPEKYSLLTKTEAKDDYLLTDRELYDSAIAMLLIRKLANLSQPSSKILSCYRISANLIPTSHIGTT